MKSLIILISILSVASAECSLKAVITASGTKGLFRTPYTVVRTIQDTPQIIQIDDINAGARGDTVTVHTGCGGTCERGFCWEIK